MTEATHQKTTLYLRWNIARTAKNGWEPKDMTISATFEEGREPTHEQMVALAGRAITEAQDACNQLNHQDTAVTRFTESMSNGA